MPTSKLIQSCLAVLLVFMANEAFAHQASCSITGGRSKLNAGLLKLIKQAQDADADCENILVVGTLTADATVNSTRSVESLFGTNRTRVRGMKRSARGMLVAYSTTLAGVLRAAGSDSVLNLQLANSLQTLGFQ